jgi:diguanylate cyclase (GGDEF)-like protein/PAS domain S-box-containing protein
MAQPAQGREMDGGDKTGSGFYQELLDNLYDGVYYVDRRRRITFWNKAAETITGYSRQEVLGRKCSQNLLRHVDDQGVALCLKACPLVQTIKDGKSRTASIYLHHKDGHRLPVSVRAAPLRDDAGRILGAIEVFSDNSEKVASHQRLKELENLAYLDPLTGIGNHRYLQIFLEARFNELKRHGWSFGLIFADIDHFKAVNDNHGHQVGDLVLKMVATTLAKNCRSFDLVGRWGGEEFLCVLSHLNELRELQVIGERFRHLVANSFLTQDDHRITVTISLGATLARPDDAIEGLIQRADRLLYQSKNAGRNCLHLG